MLESNAASTSETPDDLFVADLVQGVSDKVRRGEPVDLDALLAEHPQYARRLKRLLPTIQALAGLDAGAGNDDNNAMPEDLVNGALEARSATTRSCGRSPVAARESSMKPGRSR